MFIWLVSLMITTGVVFDSLMLSHGNIREVKHASTYYTGYQMARSTVLFVLVILLLSKLSSINRKTLILAAKIQTETQKLQGNSSFSSQKMDLSDSQQFMFDVESHLPEYMDSVAAGERESKSLEVPLFTELPRKANILRVVLERHLGWDLEHDQSSYVQSI